MKKLICILLLIIVCFSFVGCTNSKPDRVHVYGDIYLGGTTYQNGYQCFEIVDFDSDTKRVKIKGLERYGWIAIYNGDFYTANEDCPHCW